MLETFGKIRNIFTGILFITFGIIFTIAGIYMIQKKDLPKECKDTEDFFNKLYCRRETILTGLVFILTGLFVIYISISNLYIVFTNKTIAMMEGIQFFI